VLNERHLQRILREYFGYYHEDRPHLSLDRNAPEPRDVELPDRGVWAWSRALGDSITAIRAWPD
jgi:hypothetical protein